MGSPGRMADWWRSYVNRIAGCALFIVCFIAAPGYGDPLPADTGGGTHLPGDIMPRVELQLSYADRSTDPEEWRRRVASLDDIAAVDVLIEERFAEWLRRRFLEEGDGISPGQLLASVTSANLEYLYYTDAEGGIQRDRAGAPRMRTTAGLADDRAAWQQRANEAIDDAVAAWQQSFEARRARLFADLEGWADPEAVGSALRVSLDGDRARLRREYHAELEAIMRLEEQRFVAKRTRDQWSLRRRSEAETASEISAALIAESEQRLAEGLERLEAALEPAQSGDPAEVAVDAGAWRESFRAQFDAGMRRWDEAEERLIAERVEWERQAGIDLERGEHIWSKAYRELREARAEWQRGLRNIVERGEQQWANEHEALEATIFEARRELERAITERKASARDRIHNLVEMYASARDTLRASLESAEYWVGQLEFSDGSDDAIRERSEVGKLLAAETAGAYQRVAEGFDARYLEPMRTELQDAQEALDTWILDTWIEENPEYVAWRHFVGILPHIPDYPDPPQHLVDEVEAAETELARRESAVEFVDSLVTAGFDIEAFESWAVFDSHEAVGVDTGAMSDVITGWGEDLSESLVETIFSDIFAVFHNRRSASQLLFWSATWDRYVQQAEQAMADLMGTYGVTLVDEPFTPNGDELDIHGIFEAGSWETIYLDDYQIELLKARATEEYWGHQLSIAESVYDYAHDTSSNRPTEAQTMDALEAAREHLEASQSAYEEAVNELEAGGERLAGDRQRMSDLIADIDRMQLRLSEAREEYRTLMDLHLGQNYDFYQRRVAEYFTQLAGIWGLDGDSDGGEEWSALLELRDARAAYEAEYRYVRAWNDIAAVTDEIAEIEYTRWKFASDPEEFEASLSAFHEGDVYTLSVLHEQWREVAHVDPATARLLRIEIEAVAGRADSFAEQNVRELEEGLALLTAPDVEQWLQRSAVPADVLDAYGIHSMRFSDIDELLNAIAEAEAREEAAWLARRAEREAEAVELLLVVLSEFDRMPDGSQLLSQVELHLESSLAGPLDSSPGSDYATGALAATLWASFVDEGQANAPEPDWREQLKSFESVLRELVHVLNSLEALESVDRDAITAAVRPLVEREHYASRFLTGQSVFTGHYDDISRSIAESDRGALAGLTALRRAVERHGDTAPAFIELQANSSRSSLASAFDAAGLLSHIDSEGTVEPRAPGNVSAMLASLSTSELSRWRSETARSLRSAAAGLGQPLQRELLMLLDDAVAMTLAERATSGSPQAYAVEREAAESKIEARRRELQDVHTVVSALRDPQRSARSRLAGVIEWWYGNPAMQEELEATVSVLGESIAVSVAGELALRYDGGFSDRELLTNAAAEEVEAVLERIGAQSLISAYGERFTEKAVSRLELARLRFSDLQTIEWAALDSRQQLFITLSNWEHIPPEEVEAAVAAVNSTAVALIDDFVTSASLSKSDPLPDIDIIEYWMADRYFDGSKAHAEVLLLLDTINDLALTEVYRAGELAEPGLESKAEADVEAEAESEAESSGVFSFLEDELESAGELLSVTADLLTDAAVRAQLINGPDAGYESRRLGLIAEYVERIYAAAEELDGTLEFEAEFPGTLEEVRKTFLLEVYGVSHDNLVSLDTALTHVLRLTAEPVIGDITLGERIADTLGLAGEVSHLTKLATLDGDLADPYRRAVHSGFSEVLEEDVAFRTAGMLGIETDSVSFEDRAKDLYSGSELGIAFEAIRSGRSGKRSGELLHPAGAGARAIQETAFGYTGRLDGGVARFAANAGEDLFDAMRIAAAIETNEAVAIDGYTPGKGTFGDPARLLSAERASAQRRLSAAIPVIEQSLTLQTQAISVALDAAEAEREILAQLQAAARRYESGEFAARSFNNAAYLPDNWETWDITDAGLDATAGEDTYVLATFEVPGDWAGQEYVSRSNAFTRSSARIADLYATSEASLAGSLADVRSGETPATAFHNAFTGQSEESLIDRAAGWLAGTDRPGSVGRSTSLHWETALERLESVRSHADQLKREIAVTGGGIRTARENLSRDLTSLLGPVESEITSLQKEIASVDQALIEAIDAFEHSNEAYLLLRDNVDERSDEVDLARVEMRRAEAIMEFASSGYLNPESQGQLEDDNGELSQAVDPADRLETAHRRYVNAAAVTAALERLHEEGVADPRNIDIEAHPQYAAYQLTFKSYEEVYRDLLSVEALEALFNDALSKQESIVTERFEEANEILFSKMAPIKPGRVAEEWLPFIAFEHDQNSGFPGFAFGLEAGATSGLHAYVEAEHEQPRASDDPDKRDIERHRHEWLLGVGDLLARRGSSVLTDWGLAMYHRDLQLYNLVSEALRHRSIHSRESTQSIYGDQEYALEHYLWSEYGTSLNDSLGITGPSDIAGRWDELEALHELLGTAVTPPRDMLSGGIADFLEGSGLLRNEIKYERFIHRESKDAYDRVMADPQSRRLFEYYAGLHRLGTVGGNSADGILRDTAEAQMSQYIIRTLSSERRRHRNAADRDRRRANRATAAGIATLPWPPAARFFAAATALYATSAGHADNARRVGEIRSDMRRNSSAARNRARDARRRLQQAAGEYERAYAELVYERERLAVLRGNDKERVERMEPSDISASIELAAEVMGEKLADYLGDARFAEVGDAVTALFGSYSETLSDAERGSTASFIAATRSELQRVLSHTRTALEAEARSVRNSNLEAMNTYRQRFRELSVRGHNPDEHFEPAELVEDVLEGGLFSKREHERALLNVHHELYGRFDPLNYRRLAEFDRRHMKALSSDLLRLVDGRYKAYLAARENEFESLRDDLATRQAEWVSTMTAISERGRMQWRESERRMNRSRERWLERTESAYEASVDRWDGRYLSLHERRADWIERAARAAAKVGSATVLESIGASAEEAIAELESAHIGAVDTGGVDADSLVAEALGGYNFAGILARGRVMNASIPRGRANIFAGPGADRFADGAVLHRIRQARRADSGEIEKAVSLVSAEQARRRFVQIAGDMKQQVEHANELVETNVDRIYTGAGWSLAGPRFRRNTLIGDTVFSGAIRENHSVRRYRHFSDYDFDIETDLSPDTLSRMSARGIEAQLDAAVRELEAERDRIFGDPDADAQTVAEAGQEARMELDRGWFAGTFDIGDGSSTITRQVDAVLQPGLFGEHVGYAPQLRPDIDFDRSWRRSVVFPGTGQMHRLMGEFSYYEAMQAAGYGELNAGLHNTPLWHGSYAPTIRQVADVGVGVAGAFMSGGSSLALTMGSAAAWGAVDAASGDGTLGQAMLGVMQAGAITGVNHMSGLAGGAVGDIVGADTMLGGMGGNLTRAAVANIGSGAVHSVRIDDVRGLGFSTDSFLQASLCDRALAGYGGTLAGDLAVGRLEGFSGTHKTDVETVGAAFGSGVQAGLEYGMTGNTVVNIANLRDVGFLAGQEWNSAGLAELHLGDDGMGVMAGRGGVDLSASRLRDVSTGVGTFVEQQRMRVYDMLGGVDAAADYDGTRLAGTSLRALYSYGDSEGLKLRDAILRGDTVLRAGYEQDFEENDLHKAFTSVGSDGETIVSMRTLGDRGRDGLSGRLIAGLTMQHEARRDGYGAGDTRSDGTVVTGEENTAETESAVFARMGMAARMMDDRYERQLLSNDFLRSEHALYEAARQTDQLDVFGRYAAVGYGSEEDDFFARVSSDGMYQNDWSMRELLTVALLDGPQQPEIDQYNEAHRRELYEQYLTDYGEGALDYSDFEEELDYDEFARRLKDSDERLVERYDYQPQQKIDVWTYGCALYSLGYMVNKATGQIRNPVELNEAMRENGYYSFNSRGQGTLLSTANIVAALNSFTDSSVSFEHERSAYNPEYTDFSQAHNSEDEYFGYLRVAHPEPELRDKFPNGIHSEVIHEMETVVGPRMDQDVLSGSISTANPWDAGRAAPGSYSEYIGRSRREFDEIQRMDLIRVHRHEPEEPYWSQLGLDSWW